MKKNLPQMQYSSQDNKENGLAASAPAHSAPASVGLQAALDTAVQRYRLLADNVPDVVYSLDEFGVVVAVNKSVIQYGFRAEELIGTNIVDLIHPEDRERVVTSYCEIVAKRESCSRTQQFRIVSRSGAIHWFEANCSIQFGDQGQFILQEGVCRDITASMQSRYTQNRIRVQLEELVRIRTAELTQKNDELHKEILERRETERILREREADLEMEKGNLQETNTALKVLLKRREMDKHEFEEQVMCNVKEFVLPYLDVFKRFDLDARQEAYVSIIESNLSDITSAFSRRLSLSYYDLTLSERRVANFIRQGKKTREIALLMGISERTVEAYRYSLRKKMRLQNRKANLRTFLLSISGEPEPAFSRTGAPP